MNILNLLGEIFVYNGRYKFINTLLEFMNKVIVPFTISLTVLTAIFTLVLVFLIIKAESVDRAEEYKKRMKGLLLTVIIVIVFVWVFSWFLEYLDVIIDAVKFDF